MLHNLMGWPLVILVVVLLLIFGATRLPSAARGLGQSIRIARQELKRDEPDDPNR